MSQKRPLFLQKTLARGFRSAAGLFLFGWLSISSVVFSQDVTETKLKAQYILNISKFVSWPENPRELALCLLGNDPIANDLKQLDGTSVRGAKIQFQQYRNQNLIDGCHILVIAESEKLITKKIASRINEKPILTISDQTDFLEAGGMVKLYRQGSRLRFDIGLKATQTAQLKISSKLLKLAGNKPRQGGNNNEDPS